MIFFLRSFFAQIFLNGFMVFRIWKSRDLDKGWKWLLIVVYAIETLLYFVGLLSGYRLPIEFYTLIQVISGIWVVTQSYLVSIILLFDLFFFLDRRFHFLSMFKEQSIHRSKRIVFAGILMLLSYNLYTGYNHFIHPDVKHYAYTFGDDTKGPKAHFRMLVAADLHLGYIVNARILERFVNEMNAQHPDIVVINGDLIDYELRPVVAGKMDSILRRIQAPHGVFFVPGNHEYKLDGETRLQWIADHCGMTVLRDSVAMIDSVLYLIGRDDRSNKEKRLPIDQLLQQTDAAFPRILFAHQPDDIPDSYFHDISLTICGHTHSGQIFPANLAVQWIFPNGYGWQHSGNSASYTTSGLGLSGFPLRISNRSEMIVFDITIY